MIRWIRSLLRRPERPDSPGQRDATFALARAENDLRDAEDRQPQVTEAAGQLRWLRDRNHFAQLFDSALRGGHR